MNFGSSSVASASRYVAAHSAIVVVSLMLISTQVDAGITLLTVLYFHPKKKQFKSCLGHETILAWFQNFSLEYLASSQNVLRRAKFVYSVA